MYVRAPKGIADADFEKFADVDAGLLTNLNYAHNEIESAVIAAEETVVDSEAQREYAKTVIDSMRYLLERITQALEAE